MHKKEGSTEYLCFEHIYDWADDVRPVQSILTCRIITPVMILLYIVQALWTSLFFMTVSRLLREAFFCDFHPVLG